MEERIDDQVAVLVETDHVAPCLERSARRSVSEHRTLGRAGRAGREHDVAQIVAGHGRRSGVNRCVVDRISTADEVGERVVVQDRSPQHHDLLQFGGRPAPVRRAT